MISSTESTSPILTVKKAVLHKRPKLLRGKKVRKLKRNYGCANLVSLTELGRRTHVLYQGFVK